MSFSVNPVDGSGKISVGNQVGTGAEGTVYQIVGSDEVLKVLDEDLRGKKDKKVHAMVDNRPIDPTFCIHGIRTIVWPTSVVYDEDSEQFVGYRMPYKNLGECESLSNHLLKDKLNSESDLLRRVILARNLAIAVSEIHRQGHALGDMNPKNILVNDLVVSLIDCDGFFIRGARRSYPGGTFRPSFTPPSGLDNNIDDARLCDRFGLAVHIFKILMNNYHPFHAQGVETVSGSFEDWIREYDFPYEDPKPGRIDPPDSAPDYQTLPDRLRELFAACFREGKQDGDVRPTASEWATALNGAYRGETSTSESIRDDLWAEWELSDEDRSGTRSASLWGEWIFPGARKHTERANSDEDPWTGWGQFDGGE